MSVPRRRLKAIETLEHLAELLLDAREGVGRIAYRRCRPCVGLRRPLPTGESGGVELAPSTMTAATAWG